MRDPVTGRGQCLILSSTFSFYWHECKIQSRLQSHVCLYHDIEMISLRFLLFYLCFKDVLTLSGKFCNHDTFWWILIHYFLTMHIWLKTLHHFFVCLFFVQETFGTWRTCTGIHRTNWGTILNLCVHPVVVQLQTMQGSSGPTCVTHHGTWLTPLCLPWRTFYQTLISSYGQGLYLRQIHQPIPMFASRYFSYSIILIVFISVWCISIYFRDFKMPLLPFRDDTPHVPNEDLGERAVLDIIGNLTEIIMQMFPGKRELTKGYHT